MITETIRNLSRHYKDMIDAQRRYEEGDWDWTEDDYSQAKEEALDAEYAMVQEYRKLTPEELVTIHGCDLEEAQEINVATDPLPEIESAGSWALELILKEKKAA